MLSLYGPSTITFLQPTGPQLNQLNHFRNDIDVVFEIPVREDISSRKCCHEYTVSIVLEVAQRAVSMFTHRQYLAAIKNGSLD